MEAAPHQQNSAGRVRPGPPPSTPPKGQPHRGGTIPRDERAPAEWGEPRASRYWLAYPLRGAWRTPADAMARLSGPRQSHQVGKQTSADDWKPSLGAKPRQLEGCRWRSKLKTSTCKIGDIPSKFFPFSQSMVYGVQGKIARSLEEITAKLAKF